jgi:hypothetical protein
MPADVVTLVVAADDDDGATAKLKPVADGAVDDPVAEAEAEANVGVEAADEANENAGVVAEELAAPLAFENNEGAEAACEVAKEKPVEGVDAGVAGVADVLFGNEKAEPEEAENREGVVFVAVGVAVEPNDEVAAVVAGEAEMPNDGAVVAAAAGDEAAAELKSGAEAVDPNSDEPVAAPNPRDGEEAGVEAVLDAAAPELSEKANAGVEAAAVVAVEPDAGVPKPKPVAAPEKRLGVDAAEEEAAPNGLGVVPAAEVIPNKPGVVAAEEVAPNKP